MGLGKTVQTLVLHPAPARARSRGANLIVVPTSVLPNWEREAQKFVPGLRQLIIYARAGRACSRDRQSDLVVTTYALLRRDLDELLKFVFNTTILDEAQKHQKPQHHHRRSVRRLSAKTRLCLSGTPSRTPLRAVVAVRVSHARDFWAAQNAFQRGIVKPIKTVDEETLEISARPGETFICGAPSPRWPRTCRPMVGKRLLLRAA
jgi:non-specific serine/threonine protein kinase